MKQLQLPPTVRTVRIDEIPYDAEVIENVKKRESANIVEGYTIQPNTSIDFPFTFYAEINVDNDNLWKLFKVLMIQLPDEVALIYGHIDEDAQFGRYMDKFELLNILEGYQIELTQDGFLEFGVIFQNKTFMEEVFVKKSKYISFWGADEDRFRKTLSEFEIYEVPNLNFIDEFPMATESLRSYHPDAMETLELINQLTERINNS